MKIEKWINKREPITIGVITDQYGYNGEVWTSSWLPGRMSAEYWCRVGVEMGDRCSPERELSCSESCRVGRARRSHMTDIRSDSRGYSHSECLLSSHTCEDICSRNSIKEKMNLFLKSEQWAVPVHLLTPEEHVDLSDSNDADGEHNREDRDKR